ncbi:Site-specific DNA recombinase [Singulisphaera sp. GP187]|uniref:recombinase family protein n=1 Tax=Singulisphaera sp. GP187 TaxID=1882752 RepID=UPI00092A6578|nr:recombinase family protein [Singulisphaera sp. GP187]SIO10822.1 Site-specific DNA recombinase [Singulisphaera sp. GP187]
MPPRLAPPKIRPEHLDRQALIYVRQSTPMQVRDNIASTARQYDLARRAEQFGWPKERIHVIDQDQGHSGASALGRDGFQYLMAEVGLGRAGAVLSLEASRLARSCSDWYRLIEICGLTDTLVIDEDGVYDPTQYNDRLLLGIKGTMSEAELHWIRSRLLGGKLEKARTGQLRSRPPTGLVYDPAGQTVLDPDEQVQQALRLVFDTFEQVGAALGVVQFFAANQFSFPTRHYGGSRDGQLTWRPLDLGRVLAILHNPTYTGTYVYGRTKTRNILLPGEGPRIKGRTRRVVVEDWPFVLHDHHPAYITWEQFQRNQRRLLENCTSDHQERRGALREGAALLQGLVLCGRCGRRMTIRYMDDGKIPLYECNQLHKNRGEKTCQSLRGDRIDAAVARVFLEAMRPAQLEVSMAAIDQISQQARRADRQWDLMVERANYDAELARRRFQAVDPENRLVARTLEREWEARLAEVERLERESAARPTRLTRLVDPAERTRILALAQDLPALWQAETTTQVERKQLLGFLIKDVCLTRAETTIEVAIRWRTEACTLLNIPRPKRSCDARRTDPAVLARLRTLAADHPDCRIAQILDLEGFRSGTGRPFTTTIVKQIRYSYSISSGCPDRPAPCADGYRADGRCTASVAAARLNVTVSTIADWCQSGHLDGIQSTSHGAWWIQLTPEIIARLRKPARRSWTRRSAS